MFSVIMNVVENQSFLARLLVVLLVKKKYIELNLSYLEVKVEMCFVQKRVQRLQITLDTRQKKIILIGMVDNIELMR